METQKSQSSAEPEVRALYQQLLAAWNNRNARGMTELFAAEGNVVGFDGSQMTSAEIEPTLGAIFANHPTAAYVSKVRSVQFPVPEVAILRSVVGMLPPGKTDLNPAVNAIQSLVAAKLDGNWRIVLFQNTPATFHGRPELQEQLTEELRQVLCG